MQSLSRIARFDVQRVRENAASANMSRQACAALVVLALLQAGMIAVTLIVAIEHPQLNNVQGVSKGNTH